MNKLLLSIFILVFSVSIFATESKKGVEGYLKGMWCGEMDPTAIGDICAVFVEQNKTKRLYGYLIDYDYNVDMREDINEMAKKDVYVYVSEEVEKIFNKHKLRVLKDFNNMVVKYEYGKKAYWMEFYGDWGELLERMY